MISPSRHSHLLIKSAPSKRGPAAAEVRQIDGSVDVFPLPSLEPWGRSRRFSRNRAIGSEEDAMNWDRVEGNWKQFAGKLREKWGDLSDNDLEKINGRRDQLEGVLQERYGIGRDVARKHVDEWLKTLH
jgi:uncharacterized protein YjbJ (UPF0337 family)